MPDSALGALLRELRNERGLTFRETAQLAEVDGGYINRLESGARESPSEEILAKLDRALKPGKRESEMLRYLADHSEVDRGLVTFVRADPSVSFSEFAMLASISHRGPVRVDYARLLSRARRIIADEEDGG